MARVLKVLKNKGHEQNRRPPDYGRVNNKIAGQDFLANVNSCSCSLYVVVRPSVRPSVCLSVVCRL